MAPVVGCRFLGPLQRGSVRAFVTPAMDVILHKPFPIDEGGPKYYIGLNNYQYHFAVFEVCINVAVL